MNIYLIINYVFARYLSANSFLINPIGKIVKMIR